MDGPLDSILAERRGFSLPKNEEFKVAPRFQDPDESEPLSTSSRRTLARLTRTQLDEYIRTNQAETWLNDGESHVEDDSLYKPCCTPSEIRVLEIFPAEFDDPIEGKLHHVSVEFEYTHFRECLPDIKKANFGVSFEEGRPICYTALSYVWGAPDFSCSVKIGKHVKWITKTLDTALRHLRHNEHPVVIWVDQISINQNDIKEKEAQIPLMETIYSKAWNTVIWLGEESAQTAFTALQHLYEEIQFRDEDLHDAELQQLRDQCIDSSEISRALQNLFQRPWFGRTWTIQEAALSRNLYVMTGTYTIPWEDFAGYCVGISHMGIFNVNNESELPGLEVAAKIWSTQMDSLTLVSKSNLLSTLVGTRYAQASNPLDTVYGILSLCEHAISPDYSKSVANLLTEVAIHCISERIEWLQQRHKAGDRSLDIGAQSIFSTLCCVDHVRLDFEMPSFVPNWVLPRETTSLGFSSASASYYYAGGNAMHDAVSIADGGKRLLIRAKLVASVASISTAFTNGELFAVQSNPSLRQAIQFATSKPERIEVQDGLFLTFCKTLVAGKNGAGMLKYPEEYTEILSLLCDGTMSTEEPVFKDQTYTPRQKKGKFSLANLQARRPGRTFSDMRKAYKATMLNRCLCWTEDGMLGLVPRYTQPSDKVAVFIGCPVPFVVRKRSDPDEFELVGECYVERIMNAEAIKDESIPLQQIALV